MTPRYRLRFLLQEFDLPRGITLIGRSSECLVTIEDPLVSRQHARIVITDQTVTCEDLGSRNGVKVNGVAVKQPTPLNDGDRIRIGTQELVFCHVHTAPDSARLKKVTGFLRYCGSCRLPYPQELAACPSCGSTEQVDEEEPTVNEHSDGENNAWGLRLIVEVAEKAWAANRVGDAIRFLGRAREQIDRKFEIDGAIEPDQIRALARVATAVGVSISDPAWVRWSIDVHRILRMAPAAELVDAWGAFPVREELSGSLDQLITALAKLSTSDAADDAARVKLAALRHS